MAQGKFSQPRPNRDEDRQIEEAFRQVTGQSPRNPRPQRNPEDEALIDLLSQEDAFPSQEPQMPLPEDGFLPLEEDGFTSFQQTHEEPGYIPTVTNQDPEPDDCDPEESDWVDRAMAFVESHKKWVLAGVSAFALVLLISVMAVFLFSSSDPYDNRILDNVYLADVSVGGMTKKEAAEALRKTLGQSYAKTDMILDLGDLTLPLFAKSAKVTVDVKAAAKAAFDYGRTGSQAEQEQALSDAMSGPQVLSLLPYLKMDTQYLQTTLQAYADQAGSTLKQTAYTLEGEQPELATDKFDEKAPTQTLVITMGNPGVGFDTATVYQQVLESYGHHRFQVKVQTFSHDTQPDPLDWEAVQKAVCIEPVDVTLNMQTFQPIPGSYGYDFDLEAAQKAVEEAEFGQEVRIPMRYVAPEVLEDDVLYRDVLGEYQTKHTSNANRNTNLRLACEALNGKILKPGESLSFNDTLGKRTTDKGYKPAPAYAGQELVDQVGGGICQVSSTLYYSVLLADLDVLSRINHGLVPSYIPYGLDATVSWGGPDFKFRNSTNFPIKIEAQVTDGYVKIRILGTEERDYYVKMEYKITATQEPETEYQDFPHDNDKGYKDGDVIQEGTTGYTVKTYKLKYNRKTNELISRDFEANSQYQSVKKIVARVEPEETTAPTEAPTQPPTEAPTTQPTTPPTTQPTEPATQPTTPSTEPVETTQPVTTPSQETTAPTVQEAA